MFSICLLWQNFTHRSVIDFLEKLVKIFFAHKNIHPLTSGYLFWYKETCVLSHAVLLFPYCLFLLCWIAFCKFSGTTNLQSLKRKRKFFIYPILFNRIHSLLLLFGVSPKSYYKFGCIISALSVLPHSS